jgi:hypothetical protein
MKKYTIEEFRIYLAAQDSMGDIFYNLKEEKIDKALDDHFNNMMGDPQEDDDYREDDFQILDEGY